MHMLGRSARPKRQPDHEFVAQKPNQPDNLAERDIRGLSKREAKGHSRREPTGTQRPVSIDRACAIQSSERQRQVDIRNSHERAV